MSKHIDFLVVPQGREPALNFRLPVWLVKAVLIALLCWLVGLIAATILYGRLASKAISADLLERENERLRDYNAKVLEIEKSFEKNMAMVARIAEMAGVEIENIPISAGLTIDSANKDTSAAASVSGLTGDQIPVSIEELEKIRTPQGRPLYGWITRGFNLDGSDGKEKHQGIDIAVKEGTPVVATATGDVIFSGWDKAFGNMITIDHGNGFQSNYGHNQKNIVSKGQKVYKGDVIALSGNTGRSSAPHLHYEVIKDGVPINPAPYLD